MGKVMKMPNESLELLLEFIILQLLSSFYLTISYSFM